MEIVAATNNKGKMAEFERILQPLGFKILTLDALGFDGDIEETGQTFEENAFIKAFEVAERFKKPGLADDSGLCVDALNGEPGIHSARFGGAISNAQRPEKLLSLMEDVPDERRTARFVCVLCFIDRPDEISSFEQAKKSGKALFVRAERPGIVERSGKGINGFGFDPIFSVCGKTIAEMTPHEKDAVSARGAAIRDFALKMRELGKLWL
ncbi:MAG: RdgB/HAM1 family non-canonical purine NTP pyrophosphatase [Oscillospiraceae bacterium]|nr:RdgB/HAM1 family non-canonical purine NTP pyrophosphatase [Oscillospiraceae bacterium]